MAYLYLIFCLCLRFVFQLRLHFYLFTLFTTEVILPITMNNEHAWTLWELTIFKSGDKSLSFINSVYPKGYSSLVFLSLPIMRAQYRHSLRIKSLMKKMISWVSLYPSLLEMPLILHSVLRAPRGLVDTQIQTGTTSSFFVCRKIRLFFFK